MEKVIQALFRLQTGRFVRVLRTRDRIVRSRQHFLQSRLGILADFSRFAHDPATQAGECRGYSIDAQQPLESVATGNGHQ